MVIRLVVVEPESKKGSFAVRLPIVVGRSEDAKFRIQQDRVSRKHCELFAEDGIVHLRDLGSTNGTFLDNEQLTADRPRPVSSGGTVRVGSLVFRVEYESRGEPKTTIAPAPGRPDALSSDDAGSTSGAVTSGAVPSGTVPIGGQTDGEVVGLQVETSHTDPEVDDAAFEPMPEDAPADDTAAAAPEPEDVAADDPTAGVDTAAAGEPAAGGFAFLDGADPAAHPEGEGTIDWLPPGGEGESAAPPDDDKLGDFLKGLP